jgi:glyoxylase-like metal-dependent hydrolase (beta-lactamase superfamily II)
MIGVEVRPGLWRWTAYHEEWGEDVACAAVRQVGRLVLIDPLLAPADAGVFDEARGEDVEVLVTVFWHARSAALLYERLGARVWAFGRARAAVARRAPVARSFRIGDALPAGAVAFPTGRHSEVVFWLPAQHAVVAGDVLRGAGDSVELCPANWVQPGRTLDDLAAALRPLLGLPVDVILTGHGEPVLRHGAAALARLLGP